MKQHEFETLHQPLWERVDAALEKGSYTKEPVQTQFGWHVIRLEDTRDSTPPPFEDVKDRLKMMLANQKLQQHVETVRDSAQIDIK